MHPITLRMLGAGSLIRLERLSSRCNTNPAQRGHKKKTNEKSILTQYWLNIDFYLKKPDKTNEFWKVNIDLVNIDFGSSQYWLFEFSISFIMFFELKVNIESILTQYWLFGVFFQCLARPLPVRPVAVWCRSVKLFAPNLFSWGLASTKKGYRLSIVHRSVSGTPSVVRSSINPRPSFHTSSFDIRWVFGEWLIGLGRRSIDNR